MATPNTSPGSVYGLITLDGQQYIERPQVFVAEVNFTTEFQVITNLRLTLPGVANFLLKGLTRDEVAAGGGATRRFRFRIVNSEGTTWFWSGGLGIFDDRTVDTMCFGSGQFPFPLIPPVPVHATGSLIYEVEDLGPHSLVLPFAPYTVYLGFHGSYLFPPEEVATKGPLAFPGVTNGIIRTG